MVKPPPRGSFTSEEVIIKSLSCHQCCRKCYYSLSLKPGLQPLLDVCVQVVAMPNHISFHRQLQLRSCPLPRFLGGGGSFYSTREKEVLLVVHSGADNHNNVYDQMVKRPWPNLLPSCVKREALQGGSSPLTATNQEGSCEKVGVAEGSLGKAPERE